jgi:DNA-binding protein H-NS
MAEKSLAQIEKQIARLQKEAQGLRRRQLADVIARVRETIAQYNLTAEDLFAAGRSARRATVESASASSAALPTTAAPAGPGKKSTRKGAAKAAQRAAAASTGAETAVAKAARTGRSKGVAKSASAKKTRVFKGLRQYPPKYRDDAGNTWSGQGKRPKWFLAALAAGKQVQDLLIT